MQICWKRISCIISGLINTDAEIFDLMKQNSPAETWLHKYRGRITVMKLITETLFAIQLKINKHNIKTKADFSQTAQQSGVKLAVRLKR